MPANRSYDVFLLERGTKLTLISQSFNLMQHQPTLTLTRHDTLLYISKTVHKVLDDTCQNLLASEMMDCIIDKVRDFAEKNLTKGNFFLPFHYKNVFPKLHSKSAQCSDDVNLVRKNIMVNIYLLSVEGKLKLLETF